MAKDHQAEGCADCATPPEPAARFEFMEGVGKWIDEVERQDGHPKGGYLVSEERLAELTALWEARVAASDA